MKKYLFTIIILLVANALDAQVIDNKGNRNQTYPLVTETNPTIVEMINQVDTMNLYNTIAWMQQYIRDATQPEALIVQNYLLDRFEEIGLETYIHNHTATIGETDTLDAGNVIAIQPGTEFPDEYIIIAAHYDHPDGPGADDNASGTSGVLECARILSQYQFKRTILYIPFNGEELWMVGSYPFVQKCAREDMNIDWFLAWRGIRTRHHVFRLFLYFGTFVRLLPACGQPLHSRDADRPLFICRFLRWRPHEFQHL